MILTLSETPLLPIMISVAIQIKINIIINGLLLIVLVKCFFLCGQNVVWFSVVLSIFQYFLHFLGTLFIHLVILIFTLQSYMVFPDKV